MRTHDDDPFLSSEQHLIFGVDQVTKIGSCFSFEDLFLLGKNHSPELLFSKGHGEHDQLYITLYWWKSVLESQSQIILFVI